MQNHLLKLWNNLGLYIYIYICTIETFIMKSWQRQNFQVSTQVFSFSPKNGL